MKSVGSKGGNFTDFPKPEIIPAGVHAARCCWVIGLGDQHTAMYEKWQPKIHITYELPGVPITFEDKEGVSKTMPRVISPREYTISMHEKSTLRRDMQAWLGRQFTDKDVAEFDADPSVLLKSLIGKTCFLQVVHNPNKTDPSKIYANIGAIMQLPEGSPIGDLANPPIYFDMDDCDDPDEAMEISKIPKWIREKIAASQDYINYKAAFSVAGAQSNTSVPSVPLKMDQPPF